MRRRGIAEHALGARSMATARLNDPALALHHPVADGRIPASEERHRRSTRGGGSPGRWRRLELCNALVAHLMLLEAAAMVHEGAKATARPNDAALALQLPFADDAVHEPRPRANRGQQGARVAHQS